MDSAGARTFSHTLSSDQGRALLARALAKRRRLLQQSAREFFCGIAASVSPRRRASRLAGRFNPAGAAEKVMCYVERTRLPRRSFSEAGEVSASRWRRSTPDPPLSSFEEERRHQPW